MPESQSHYPSHSIPAPLSLPKPFGFPKAGSFQSTSPSTHPSSASDALMTTVQLSIPDDTAKTPGHTQACFPIATGLLQTPTPAPPSSTTQKPTQTTWSTALANSLFSRLGESGFTGVVPTAAKPFLELESTLLSCSVTQEFIDEGSESDQRGFSEESYAAHGCEEEGGDEDEDGNPGLSNCNSKATDADGAVDMGNESLDSLIYRCSTLEVFRRAVGLAAHHSRFFARRLTTKRRASATPLTPQSLAAQLSLLVLRLNEFMAKVQASANIQISADEGKLAVLWCLHTFGFQLRNAKLQPNTSIFHKLEDHEFWIVSPPANLLDSIQPHPREAQEWLMVIDFNFTELFSVVRPTKSFAHLFDKLRKEFVGTALKDLPETIEWISLEASGSLKNRLMSVAPWRQASFLKTCFTRGLDQASRTAPSKFDDISETVKDIVLRFIHINPRLLDAIAMELKGELASPLGMSVSASISFEKHPFAKDALASADNVGFRPSGLSHLFANMSI